VKNNKYTYDDNVVITNDSIIAPSKIQDGIVMHAAEKSLMIKLAEIATKNGGDILELGFGMHLSADGVQSNPNVTSHTIIELHKDIHKLALEWAKDKPNTEILLGGWIDVLPTITKKFDGILHDTYMDSNIDKFLDYVKPNCKKGTIVAFFEYPVASDVMNGVRFSLTTEEYESLPYKDILHFNKNSIELKYTTFDGIKFVKDKNLKSLI
jgi:guanidinoacetate N-methyltransferase